MLAESRQYLREAPWSACFQAVSVILLVLALNAVSDALRDVLDRHTSHLRSVRINIAGLDESAPVLHVPHENSRVRATPMLGSIPFGYVCRNESPGSGDGGP